ncbi:DUF547 domain-containing protein [Aliiglaciecola sp. SL4]|uniref:DUF547 domain-containing protein n=1 Tax=Aliiglaciecola sp. SL4 TaxID=3239806 RepID=UPI00355C54ED
MFSFLSKIIKIGNKTLVTSVLLTLLVCLKSQAAGVEDVFNHRYDNFNQLLTQVVKVSDDKKQTRVKYQQLANNNVALEAVLSTFSAVSKSQFDDWSEPQQLSFLINAYNGFTLKLIVDNWHEFKQGDATSIRDLGSLFSSPWKKEFFILFGKTHNLDDIEHEMIRKWFKEPRIHGALVCAAVSCPPLRNEAFKADQLDAQLDSQMQLFLADGSRNEIIIDGQQIEASLSSIFKWYREDFEKGDKGFNSLYDVLSVYSDALIPSLNSTNQVDSSHAQMQRKMIKKGNYPISFKEYDWRLNDVANF